MEKIEIKLTFDSERMEALAFYLRKEDTNVQRKMDESLEQLYEKTVPDAVREYLDAKTAPPPKSRRPPKPSRTKAEPSTPSAPAEENHGEGSA